LGVNWGGLEESIRLFNNSATRPSNTWICF